jgi:hypothetical protein
MASFISSVSVALIFASKLLYITFNPFWPNRMRCSSRKPVAAWLYQAWLTLTHVAVFNIGRIEW